MSQHYAAMTAKDITHSAHTIDLRSDTVSLPTDEMLARMTSAKLGDDVYDADPTVLELQRIAAELFGKESALFFPTGTQSNLAAVLSHCQRGEEIIVGREYHIYCDEAQGVSALGGIGMCPIDTDELGGLSLEKVAKEIKVDDFHYAISRLVCLENTVSGMVQPQQKIDEISNLAHDAGLKVHLDGARIFNAHIHTGIPVKELVATSDSVSVCLSKGLGTPVGSLLLGEGSFINKAKRNRKLLGGGMRQIGVLAACGLYALEYHIERLAKDHKNASILAQGLKQIPQLTVEYSDNQTNMLFFSCPQQHSAPLQQYLFEHGITIPTPSDSTRLVCHLGISTENITTVIDKVGKYFDRARS